MATETAEGAPAKSAESHEHTEEVKPENAQPRVTSSTVTDVPKHSHQVP